MARLKHLVRCAVAQVTDMLYKCLGQVLEHRRASDTALGPNSPTAPIGAHRKTLADILAKHASLAKDLGIAEDEASSLLDPYRRECERVLEGASLLAEVSARTKARVVAMGELMSTTLGAAFLRREFGGPDQVHWLEAREILRCVCFVVHISTILTGFPILYSQSCSGASSVR